MEAQLTDSHRSTYNAIFSHPLPPHLDWRDVRSMLSALGSAVHEEAGGTLHVLYNERTLVVRRATRQNLASIEEIMQIRCFLEHFSAAVRGASERTREVEMIVADEIPGTARRSDGSSSSGRAGKGAPSGFGRSRN